jgi:hypothetical protein
VGIILGKNPSLFPNVTAIAHTDSQGAIFRYAATGKPMMFFLPPSGEMVYLVASSGEVRFPNTDHPDRSEIKFVVGDESIGIVHWTMNFPWR